MKIDIHVHTRKTKTGDSKARDITPKQFARTVLSTDVKILAITNHNAFDLAQYEEITKQVDGAVQVWPGVELDVLENGTRAHLLVIVSPNRRQEFFAALTAQTLGISKQNIRDALTHFTPAFGRIIGE